MTGSSYRTAAQDWLLAASWRPALSEQFDCGDNESDLRSGLAMQTLKGVGVSVAARQLIQCGAYVLGLRVKERQYFFQAALLGAYVLRQALNKGEQPPGD